MKIRPISDTPKTIPTDAERGPPPTWMGAVTAKIVHIPSVSWEKNKYLGGPYYGGGAYTIF